MTVDVIRKANKLDREPIAQLAGRVFYEKSGEWLTNNAWYRLGPESFDPDGYFVATAGKDIVGMAAFRPFVTRMPGVNLPWIGVGTVCTSPEWRGRGVMRALLNAGIQHTDARGVPVSILWGDRMRYGRFGWERAGRQLDFELSARYFPQPKALSDISMLTGQGRFTVVPEGLVQHLISIQKRYDNRLPRPPQQHLVALTRPDYRTFWLTRAGEEAYAIIKDQRLYEVVGHPDLALDLVGYILHDTGKNLRTTVDLQPGPAQRSLLDRANTVRMVPTGMVRIHDLAGLLSYYVPWWKGHHRRFNDGSVVLVMRDEQGHESQTVALTWSPKRVDVHRLKCGERVSGSTVVTADRRKMAALLFGPLPIEVTLQASQDGSCLKDLFPLPLHIPPLEQV